MNSKEKLNVPASTSPKSDVPKIETSFNNDKRSNERKDKSKDKDDKDVKEKDVKDVKESTAQKSVHKRPGHRRVASEAISAKDMVKKTIPTLPAITTDTSHVAKSDKEKKDKDKRLKDKKNKVKTNTLKKKGSADSGELSARSESSEHSEALVESPSSVKALQSEPLIHAAAPSAVPSRTSAPELKTSDDGAGNNMAVELVKRIGKGATATVWQGLLNEQPVALKQVHLGVCSACSWRVAVLTGAIFRL